MQWIVLVVFALIVALAVRQYRKRPRRDTLRRGGDGVWYWTAMDGSEHSSNRNPSEPGGAWDTTSGDSDGGDGGGD